MRPTVSASVDTSPFASRIKHYVYNAMSSVLTVGFTAEAAGVSRCWSNP